MKFRKFLNKLLCKLSWHKVKKGSFDGCSIHGICERCGRELMQDSQGGWF